MLEPADLPRLDDAVIRLRRLWSGPTSRHVDELRWPGVELSTILVADTLHRLGSEEGSPEPEDEVSVAAVAARLDVAPSTASRLVDRAVRSGAVDRRPSAHDARRTALALTTTGQQMVSEARSHRHRFLGSVLADWPAHDVSALADLLSRLADAVQSPPRG
ncbi:MarR family winged helix-turn-helix transcriptional regulator [Ornithinimicrobium sp. LYQ121]|uniref:MarR family winged helix-turn-helix transcriptional regulator n=1 Tax=Ornithinimicrobium sp. LYQ121 TaxID=3378801 RepID=UPI003853A4D8